MNANTLAPTPEQAAILAAATQPQSLMISALAGTGKTTTLVMLANALPRVPTLALAFNVKIKKELEQRFPSHFTVLTMNSLGHRAWGAAINRKQFFMDDKKLGRLVTAAFEGTKVPTDVWNGIRRLVVEAMQRGIVPSYFEHYKSLQPDVPELWQEIASDLDLDLTPDDCKVARGVLIESIKEGMAGKISFDDQIYLPTMFSGDFPRFHTIMVDEAQDLSPLNHLMLKRCKPERLIVVGDPHQAIYQFRGADTASMSNMRALRPEWIDLPLTTTFRCPRLIVERQHWHVPDYRAAPTNKEGAIIQAGPQWSLDKLNIPPGASVAILCRNNAPLISTAFKLIKRRVAVSMLGRDIGKGLTSTVKKVCPDPNTGVEALLELLNYWRDREISLAEANKKEDKIEKIMDKYECICAIIEGSDADNQREVCAEIDTLFAKENGRVILSSGHRSKGLEWDYVIHLDPWRIPSKHAKSPAEIEQEHNLLYVIETRTKNTLVLANAEDME